MFSKVVIFAAVVVCALAYEPPKLYTNDFDHFDVGAFAADKERVRVFMDCISDKGPCSPLAGYFKEHFGDAYSTQCSKCNAEQKVLAKELVIALKNYFPEEFDAYIKKIDPELKHWEKYEKTVLA